MEDGILNGGVFGFVGFEDEKETCRDSDMNDEHEKKEHERHLRHLPFSYVATKVAKDATFCSAEYSSRLVSSNVRTSDVSLSAQNLFDND